MLFLLLATIASAGNALTMKFTGSRSDNAWALLLFNYLAATALSAASAFRVGLALAQVAPRTWALGLVAGAFFVATFALLQHNVRMNGATVSSSLFRMGAVIPMILSIALFGEYPTFVGACGIAVAIAATTLLAIPPKGKVTTDAVTPSARRFLIPMVLAGGLADTMPKVFETVGDPAHEEAYILMTFATAFAVCLAMLLKERERPAGVDVACGTMLGIFNFFSTDLMLRALIELPAYVVYTGFSMGVVLIVYAANVLVMHERLTRRDHVALALVILALALINLPG
jgi:drug/metabolite transporter (DMT)-like permease